MSNLGRHSQSYSIYDASTGPAEIKAGTAAGDDLATMSLADLMAAISLQADDRESADAAFGELYRRWERPRLVVVQQAVAAFPGSHIGHEELVVELWSRVFEKAHTFRSGEAKGDDLNRIFYKWVLTVAKNFQTDMYRKHIRQPLVELDDHSEAPETNRVGEGIVIFDGPKPGTLAAAQEEQVFAGLPPEKVDAIRCLRELPIKSQEVLRRSARFLKVGKNAVEIPTTLKEEIINELHTTPDGFRALKSRALKKVRECMEKKRQARRSGGQ